MCSLQLFFGSAAARAAFLRQCVAWDGADASARRGLLVRLLEVVATPSAMATLLLAKVSCGVRDAASGVSLCPYLDHLPA
jgi:hypothetical protein